MYGTTVNDLTVDENPIEPVVRGSRTGMMHMLTSPGVIIGSIHGVNCKAGDNNVLSMIDSSGNDQMYVHS